MSIDWKKISLIVGSILSVVIAYNLWLVGLHQHFDKFLGLAFLLAYAAIWYSNRHNFIESNVAQIGFYFSVNNLLDELVFNPLVAGWNEYLFALVVVIWQTFKIGRWLRHRKKQQVG